MRSIRRPAVYLTLAFALLLSLYRTSSALPSVPDDPTTQSVSTLEWWKNPGLVRDHLAVIGVAPFDSPRELAAAIRAAEKDAEGRMARALKTTRVQGRTRAYRYHWDDHNVFVLFVLEEFSFRETPAGDFEGRPRRDGELLFRPGRTEFDLLRRLPGESLKDSTLRKTEILKEKVRRRLEKMAREEEKAAKKS
ncbi:MAG: hypothetical protein AAF517_06810 [Planctomycetota bacterium]